MVDWIEYAKLIGGFIGAAGAATLAKLYHDKVVAGKNTELQIKEAEISRIKADLAKAEARARNVPEDTAFGQRDLARLRDQLTEILERLAESLHAQAASLYIPVFNARDDAGESPRGFAFVAVYNIDPEATAAILKMKLVEAWTIIGECWDKGTLIGTNDLQANVRHVASYDKQSGFVPVHTLAAPVRWHGHQVGAIQLFNKTLPGKLYEIDPGGFSSDDRKELLQGLQDTTDVGIAGRMHYFQSSPEASRFLGLQDELNLENAVILYVDLTRSSSLFTEMPLIDAARLINRFNENVYQRMSAFSAVVEKFNGDGTLVRFHYGGFDSRLPASNPVFRALCAAADLINGFKNFKATRWQGLASDTANAVKVRITIALGPVLSTNVGPKQFQVPTVMGQCVNRSAKMVAYAPRNRDLVLVDDNIWKALKQIDSTYAGALTDFADWCEASAAKSASLAGHQYFEVTALAPFTLPASQFRQVS